MSCYPSPRDILNRLSQLSNQLQLYSWSFRLISVLMKRVYTI